MVPVQHSHYRIHLDGLDIQSSDSRYLNPVVSEMLVPLRDKIIYASVCLEEASSFFSLALVISVSSSTSGKELEQTLHSDYATVGITWVQGGHS